MFTDNTPWQFAMSFSSDAPFVADGPQANAWQPSWEDERPGRPSGTDSAASSHATGVTAAPGNMPADGEADSSNG